MALATFKLARWLELVHKELGGEIQVSTLLTFLLVAERGKMTQRDVENELKMTTSTASRNVSYWTDRRSDRKEGLNYIARVQDDYDQRIRNLTLTAEGKRFYNKLVSMQG